MRFPTLRIGWSLAILAIAAAVALDRRFGGLSLYVKVHLVFLELDIDWQLAVPKPAFGKYFERKDFL